MSIAIPEKSFREIERAKIRHCGCKRSNLMSLGKQIASSLRILATTLPEIGFKKQYNPINISILTDISARPREQKQKPVPFHPED